MEHRVLEIKFLDFGLMYDRRRKTLESGCPAHSKQVDEETVLFVIFLSSGGPCD